MKEKQKTKKTPKHTHTKVSRRTYLKTEASKHGLI